MTVFALLVLAIIIIGVTLFHMAKEGGIKAEQQKQQVEATERQEKAVKAQIVIEKETIDDIKIKMKNKYTRD